MRIIFLNSWFGKTGKPFFDFIKKEYSKTDIFCFMEFSPELFDEVSEMFKDHRGYIEKGDLLEIYKLIDCQVIFVRKGLEVIASGKLNTYKTSPQDTGFTSYIAFKYKGKIINLLNVHGKARPGTKFDTPVRLKQSENIINFVASREGIKIIGGDFNLNPNTKSVEMFEEAGYRNLIKDYKITSTRNRVSWENFKSTPGFEKQHFADYAFVSPEVKVKSFEVPYTEASDHLPLILDFEV